MRALEGKRIIVTGAATGMGASCVTAYAKAGARVVAWYRKRGPEEVAKTLSEEELQRVAFFRRDVTEKADVDAGVAEAVAFLGGLDVLVNSAGISPGAPAEEITLDAWDEVMAINATGTFLTNQAVFPHLKEHGGKIINFASAAGVVGLYNKAHYAASKGAVLAWTRTLAKEWGKYGITMNSIAPAIWTPMYDRTRASFTPEQLVAHDKMMAAAVPLGGKLGDPDRDFAPMMVFLAGDGANFLTGQTYAIDGGALILT
jgi:NAD(P)-dependent dehydrogenase (short-subunit alcohol dehydrogenase family)